jgi:hypothetical protein
MSEDNIPQMEFISPAGIIAVESDLTILPEGKHEVAFLVEGETIKSPLTVRRELGRIEYTYKLGESLYRTIIFPDGRTYNSILEAGEMSPKEFQTKGTWRYTGR